MDQVQPAGGSLLCGESRADSNEFHQAGLAVGTHRRFSPCGTPCFPSEKALTKTFSLGILSTPCNTTAKQKSRFTGISTELIQSPNGRNIDGCKEKSYQETRR
jgi:hypothetical protein